VRHDASVSAAPGPVTIEDVRAARARIADAVRVTPLWPSVTFSDLAGAPILLKCEQLQRGGSFKLRGASNMLGSLQAPPRGVIAASAGNHAQGVALAAAHRGLAATIVMPAGAPLAKQAATRSYGAELVLVDSPLGVCLTRAEELAAEHGLLLVPPFDDPAVVAGQGTLGLELVEQAPDLETVIVPAGGGGLLAGVSLAVKSLRPEVRVVGVQAQAMPGVVASLEAGGPRAVPAVQTLADGAAVAGPSTLTFELIERYVDDVVAVHETDIARAMLLLIERAKQVVEGAGALGVAALLAGAVEARGSTAVVLSGGNVDINLLDRIVERGLVSEGRRRSLTVAAANVPGELGRVSSLIAATGANVIEVQHELVSADLPVGVARLTFRLDVSGPEGFARVEAELLAAGLQPGAATDFVTQSAAAMPP
jgi:threonine dehydratase